VKRAKYISGLIKPAGVGRGVIKKEKMMFDFLDTAVDHGNFKNFYLEDYTTLTEQVKELESTAARRDQDGHHREAATERGKATACKMAAETIMSVALKFPVASA
tara:strand:- start:1073 stop:1384 length:312 start_codon:yes stop_codon:yes gene_type:complete